MNVGFVYYTGQIMYIVACEVLWYHGGGGGGRDIRTMINIISTRHYECRY